MVLSVGVTESAVAAPVTGPLAQGEGTPPQRMTGWFQAAYGVNFQMGLIQQLGLAARPARAETSPSTAAC